MREPCQDETEQEIPSFEVRLCAELPDVAYIHQSDQRTPGKHRHGYFRAEAVSAVLTGSSPIDILRISLSEVGFRRLVEFLETPVPLR